MSKVVELKCLKVAPPSIGLKSKVEPDALVHLLRKLAHQTPF